MEFSNENYKRKLELGVGLVVMAIGAFFVTQALTIGASKEIVGPRTMPMALARECCPRPLPLQYHTNSGKPISKTFTMDI